VSLQKVRKGEQVLSESKFLPKLILYFASVVFSSWTKTFDLLQPVLMSRSIRCVRLDGSLSATGRERVLRVFRDNPGIAVLLATITCGGIGLNLTVASRAYIIEPQWNPMSESQALDRIHRLGQRNQVYTTRYLIRGTWEEVCNQILSGRCTARRQHWMSCYKFPICSRDCLICNAERLEAPRAQAENCRCYAERR
jgi:hypothetical protein